MATVKELREEAKKYGIKGYSKMRKAELEAAVWEFQAIQEHIDEEEKLLEDEIKIQEKLKDLYTEPAIIICKLGRYTQEEIREIASILGYELSCQANIEKVVDFIVYEVRAQLKDTELQEFLVQQPDRNALDFFLRDKFTLWELERLMRKIGLEVPANPSASELSETLTDLYRRKTA